MYGKNNFGEIKTGEGELKHTSILNDIATILKNRYVSKSFQFRDAIATVARLVETEEILMANEEHPKGAHFKVGDPHALENPYEWEMAVLIHSVEKGTPLEDLDKYFIEKTGGIEKYLVYDLPR